MTIVIVLPLTIWRLNVRIKGTNYHPFRGLWVCCFGVGILYLFALFGLRSYSNFDPFNFRLLSPFIFLLMVGYCAWLRFNTGFQLAIKPAMAILLFLICYRFLYFIPFTDFKTVAYFKWVSPDSLSTFSQNMHRIKTNYAFLPENTLLAFGEMLVNYDRLDITVARPETTPYFGRKESMNEFIERIRLSGAEHIYIYSAVVPDTIHFHPSVREYMLQKKEKEFVKLR